MIGCQQQMPPQLLVLGVCWFVLVFVFLVLRSESLMLLVLLVSKLGGLGALLCT